jgi:hypothetical protein
VERLVDVFERASTLTFGTVVRVRGELDAAALEGPCARSSGSILLTRSDRGRDRGPGRRRGRWNDIVNVIDAVRR